ncbi:MAG TPA: glycoside hydrolase family 99-like domain-containing protein [Bacteroidales bacterium]|nr:glycoside hydrolase family 99-like domain-containing protein [Bacteroidales bacterium]HNS46856.1 glycoside hydrolase family 99-like domain-containing protein [Bacteroidales bacterium]
MNSETIPVRILAFYLPQYHPIPENDQWWGEGFTEWTNVKKARPLYRGHLQPRIPAGLGYYDLRDAEAREAQAQLAKLFGIDGFCYWHYWFGGGKTLLERPLREVLASGKPDFPFCVAWANQSWTGKWHGLNDQIIVEQTYPGRDDDEKHFYHLLPAFEDARYIKIRSKPLVFVYIPDQLPDPNFFTEFWNELAVKNGFSGIYFIGVHYIDWDHQKDGFDEKTIHQPFHYIHTYERKLSRRLAGIVKRRVLLGWPEVYHYRKLIEAYDFSLLSGKDFIPTLIPNWDNTPRCGRRGVVFQGSTPESFKKHLLEGVQYVLRRTAGEKMILVKSWNEWAEGNYLEPDALWGRGYLEAIREVKNTPTAI